MFSRFSMRVEKDMEHEIQGDNTSDRCPGKQQMEIG